MKSQGRAQAASMYIDDGAMYPALPATGNNLFMRAVSAVISGMFAPFALLASETARRVLLSIIIVNIAFPLGTHLGHREDAAEFGAHEGLCLSVSTFALAGLYVPLLVNRRRGLVNPAINWRRVCAPLTIYVAFVALSVLVAVDVELCLFEVYLFCELLLLYVYIVSSASTREDVLFLVQMMLVTLVMESLLMIALAAGLPEFSILGIKARVDENAVTEITRVGGTFGSPNDVAAFLSMILVIASGVMLASVGRRSKQLAAVAICVGLVAMVLTLSRGGSSSLIIGIIIVGAAAIRRRKLSWKGPAATCVLALLIGLAFSDTLSRRLFENDNGAAESRLPLMKLAWRMIQDHPVLGVGANNFGVAMEPYVAPEFSGEFLYAVHNRYLLLWTETGIGSLLAYVWFLLATIGLGIRCWRYSDPVLSPIALGCAAALAGHMFHMSVDVFRGRTIMETVLLIGGLIVVMEHLASPARRSRGTYSPAVTAQSLSRI